MRHLEAFELDYHRNFEPVCKFTVYLDGQLQGIFNKQESVERLIAVNPCKRFEVYKVCSYE